MIANNSSMDATANEDKTPGSRKIKLKIKPKFSSRNSKTNALSNVAVTQENLPSESFIIDFYDVGNREKQDYFSHANAYDRKLTSAFDNHKPQTQTTNNLLSKQIM